MILLAHQTISSLLRPNKNRVTPQQSQDTTPTLKNESHKRGRQTPLATSGPSLRGGKRTRSSLEILPIDALSHICAFLPTPDLCTLQRVSKDVGTIAESPHVLWNYNLIPSPRPTGGATKAVTLTTNHKKGILDDVQKPYLALYALHKYASVGHPQALYM